METLTPDALWGCDSSGCCHAECVEMNTLSPRDGELKCGLQPSHTCVHIGARCIPAALVAPFAAATKRHYSALYDRYEQLCRRVADLEKRAPSEPPPVKVLTEEAWKRLMVSVIESKGWDKEAKQALIDHDAAEVSLGHIRAALIQVLDREVGQSGADGHPVTMREVIATYGPADLRARVEAVSRRQS